jgi:hypothetical protein
VKKLKESVYKQRRRQADANGGCGVPDKPDDFNTPADKQLGKRGDEVTGVPYEDSGHEQEEDVLAAAPVLSASHHNDEDHLQDRPHEVADELYKITQKHILPHKDEMAFSPD